MSEVDKESFMETPTAEIEIIIAVNEYQRKVWPWRENRDGTLSGTIDDYYFKIAGYCKQNGRYLRGQITFR